MKGLWSENFPAAGEKTPESAASPSRKMEGLWSEHFPAAGERTPESAPLGASPSRKSNRLWTENCAAAGKTPEAAPLGRFQRCLVCPSCNAACRLLKSNTVQNPGRMFYTCHSRDHDFFKWADEVKPEELIDAGEKTPETAPLRRSQRCLICPSCNAAACRLLKSNTDKNPGRMFYTCPSRDHDFFKWADEVKPEELIDVPYCGGCGAGVCRIRRETTGDNAGRILFMCTIREGYGSCGYRVWKDVALDEQSCSYSLSDTRIDTVMSKSTAFEHVAEILRNALLSLLETMDIKDHEAMTQEAEATFAALDQLLIDHQDFKKRVKGFIDCAVSLAEIEESMRNDSYQELVDRCSSARMRLHEIKCGHDEIVEAVSSSKKCLKGVQEEVASALEFIFQIQAELSCYEVELGDMEQQMETVKKGKELLEGNYVPKCKQLEECEILREVKATEYDAAKAAFNRARMMLRG